MPISINAKDTENGFQMLLQEYLPHRNKLNCVFIYDNENDQEFTYHNQKDTIIAKYETLLFIKFSNKDRYSFYTNLFLNNSIIGSFISEFSCSIFSISFLLLLIKSKVF